MKAIIRSTLLALAGGFAAATAGAIDIQVQYPAPGLFKAPIEQIVADFSKAYPDIKVTLLGPQPNYEEIVQSSLRSSITNTLPDVAVPPTV